MSGRRLPAACLAAAGAGLVTSLAAEPVGLWPLAFVGLIPFLWLLRYARPRRGALLGLCFGFAYNGAVFSWIMLFGKPAWVGISLALTAFVVIFGLLAPALWRDHAPIRSAFVWAAGWVVMEYVRGHWPLGGLTWTDLAYTQASNRTLLPLSMLTGGLGISFVIVAVNGLLLAPLTQRGSRQRWVPAAVALVLVVAPVVIPLLPPTGDTVDIATIQVDIPVAPDRAVEDQKMAEAFAAAHRELKTDPPDLAIWPENALDQDPSVGAGEALGDAVDRSLGGGELVTKDQSLRGLVLESVRATGVPSLIGIITGRPDGTQYNETIMYDVDGTIVDRYAKTHLVPYGEFAPGRSFLARFVKEVAQVRRDLTPGVEVDPISMPGLPTFGAIVCFESAFPEIPREMINDGGEFLVVSSNNSSYLDTPAAAQHLAISRVRAMELQRWVVHAGLTGPSAFIAPDGSVFDRTELFVPATIRHTITASDALTPYVRLGDWFPVASLLIMVAGFAAPRRHVGGPPVAPLEASARTLVVLPTYNEAATIGEVLSRLLELPEALDIVVVDDGSPDGTGDIVQRVASGGAPVTLLRRAGKAGLASAYASGFAVGIDGGYDIIVEMDSDLSHQPEELSGLLRATHHHADLAIGSRYVEGGSVTNWERSRVLLSKAGNSYVSLCLGLSIKDATSGFRAYRRELLESLMRSEVNADGYGFQVELADRSVRGGYHVVEVPITFREREHGQSKISRRIVAEALWLVTFWGLRDRLRPAQRPDAATKDDEGNRP